MTVRTQRVARLLQRELAAILAGALRQDHMITVTCVRVTRDLGIAYVHVSIMGATVADRQESLATLREQVVGIREALARRIRHQLRRVPRIQFFLDESLQYASEMDSLFESIRRERAQRGSAQRAE